MLEWQQDMQALDMSIIGKNCECGMFLEEGHECLDPDGLDQEGRDAWTAYQQVNALDPCPCGRERCTERLFLLEPTPFDAGVCQTCGVFVEAGRLWEHKCS